MSADGSKLSKIHQRLQNAISEKRFYEVHQILKTIHFRCVSRKNYSAALNILCSGAEFLLVNRQLESGTEVACLVLDVYRKSKMCLTEEHLNELCSLLRRMCPSEVRSTFVQKTIDLLDKQNKNLLCRFNEQLARILWQEGSFTESRFRIMLSYNGHAVGLFLIALHQRYGLRSEIDLFVAQAVLQFLCMRQCSAAIVTFFTYTRSHPHLEPGPPFTGFPLLNFLWFLMLAIEEKSALSVFDVLLLKYGPQLKRDSSYISYLDRIGQIYFGVSAPVNQTDNFLSNIMKLFSEADDDDDKGDVDNLPSTSYDGGESSRLGTRMCVDDVE